MKKLATLYLALAAATCGGTAFAGPAEDLFAQGNAADALGDKAGALKAYLSAAELGHVTSMHNAGLALYSGGADGKPNPTAALGWFEKCAAKGAPNCKLKVARMKLLGDGTAADTATGLRLYQEIAQGPADRADRADAHQALAIAALKGIGQEPSNTQFTGHLRKAAELGSRDAMRQLASHYDQVAPSPADKEEALQWYENAAKLGDARAMLAIAGYHQTGQAGLAKDPAQALQWYRRAADTGDSFAQMKVGTLLVTGTGVAKDEVRGSALLEQAAAQGEKTAQTLIGLNYERGVGVRQDSFRAMYWLELAGRQGDADAEALANSIRDTLKGGKGEELVQAATAAAAPAAAPELAGTVWHCVLAWGEIKELRFLPDGVLHYESSVTAGKFNTDGTWSQEGTSILIEVNNKFAEYRGIVDGARMMGRFKNIRGLKSTYAAYRK